MSHINDVDCSACNLILAQVHKPLADWVHSLRTTQPDLHVSEGYRGPDKQATALGTGHSKASFGRGAHNYLPAMAVDLFVLVAGQATWPVPRFHAIASTAPGFIRWGGDWTVATTGSGPDNPHFQVRGWPALVSNYPKGNVQP